MEGVKSKLDVDALRSNTISMPYPHIKITDLNKCVPVVVSALDEGELPLVGTLNGVTKIVKKISNSALNIQKLIRVTDIEVAISSTDSREINTILDYMEVSLEWI